MVVTHGDNKPVAVESDIACPARDGVALRADVYHPQDGGKYPVLLCRTPYNKLTPRYVSDARAMATKGYTVVVHSGTYAGDSLLSLWLETGSEPYDSHRSCVIHTPLGAASVC